MNNKELQKKSYDLGGRLGKIFKKTFTTFVILGTAFSLSFGIFIQAQAAIDPNTVNSTYSAPSTSGATQGGTQTSTQNSSQTQSGSTQFSSVNNPSSNNVETQSSNYLKPQNATSSTANQQPLSKQITSNVLGCSVGQILSSIIVTGITSALNSLSSLLGVWTGIPTHDAQLNATQSFQTATGQGFQVFGVYVGVSLNSIAYCIVNSIIEYISNSVINWANSGFNGNPAFVQNPERFFQGLADQQASEFINSLAYNTGAAVNGAVNNAANQIGGAVSNKVLGAMNVCAPFRKNVALNLANTYGTYGNNTAGLAQGYAPYGSCGLSDSAQNDFLQGKSRKNYFSNYQNVALNSRNNYIDQTLQAQEYLREAQIRTANSANNELNRGEGYLSPKVCVNPSDPNTCNIVTPGSTINKSLQNTLNAGQNRLILSDKFDQVVTAIVNNLIKIALNRLLTPVGAAVQSGTSAVQNNYSSRYSN